MLSDLLFGNYRKKVLSVLLLHPEADYHVRELARLTGTAPGTLHKELARLAGAGLLLRKEQGNQVRYQANQQHPVFAELASLFRKTTGAAELLGNALAPLNIPLALVFGSVASGTETAGSDVDVLVIADVGFADVVRAIYPVQAELGREVNPVVYSPAEFKRRVTEGDPFALELLAKPKIFLTGTDHDLGQLAGNSKAAAFKASPQGVQRMLAAAERNLADAQLKQLSAENRFDAAYKCIMQCAMIGLAAQGYRTSTSQPGHHQTALQALPLSMGLPNDIIIVLDTLRRQRNLNDYEGDSISDGAVSECLVQATSLLAHTHQFLRNQFPALLAPSGSA